MSEKKKQQLKLVHESSSKKQENVKNRETGIEIIGVVQTIQDITKRKKSEQERDHQAQMLNQVQDGIIRTDPDFRITYWNKGAEQMYGYSEAEALEKTTRELLRSIYAPGEREKIIDELNRLGTSKARIRTKHRNGTEIVAEVYSTRITGESGNISGYVVTYRDITDRMKAEEQLHETRDYLENLLNYANAPIIVWDKDFKIIRFNHAFEHLTGYTSEMMIGKKLDILFPKENKGESLQKIQRTLSGEYWESMEILILRKDGNIRIVLWNSANIYNKEKNLIATIAQGTDITERKKFEDELTETRNYLENLFNYANAPIIVWTPDFRISRFNHAFEKMTGHNAEEVIGKNLEILFPKESKQESIRKIQRTTIGEYWETIEIPILRKDGDIKIALWNSANIYDKDRKTVISTIAQGQDITERKQAEELLKESESRLNRAQEIAHLGSWELDLINNHLTWSDEVYRIFGLQPQEFDATYEAFLQSVHPDDRAAVDAAYSGSLREGRDTYEIEHRVARKNGEVRFVYEKCEHIRDKSGKIIRSIGMVHDITERKRIEAELVRLASFPLKNPNPIVEVDLFGKTQYLNPTSQQLFPDLEKKGFNHQFLKGIKNLMPEIQNKNKTSVAREVHINDKYYLQTITYIPENQRIRIYCTDITEQKKAEEILQESEEKYRRIVENTTNVIMVTQPDGIISYLSPSCKEILGYPPEELVGTNPMIFHPDDVKKVQQSLSQALNGEKGSGFEYRILTKQGDIKWVSHSWSPIFIGKKLQSVVSVVEDITHRKEIENNIQELNQNLMHQANELAASNKELETFSYSVSHDLRAPLRSIDGFSQALLEDYAEQLDEQGKEYIHRVRNATQRMGQLIDDMLRLSRLTRAEMTFQKVDLGQTAASVIEGLKKAEPTRNIKFITHNNLVAEGDRNLLHILLENLLGNAWKFTKKRKQAEIEFGKTKQGQETVFFVRDNGAGFNMKYADKLFIPFQRLHDDADYPGTGIGLGIVSRIIHRHGGRIWAEAEEEKGAIFYFTLGGKTNE